MADSSSLQPDSLPKSGGVAPLTQRRRGGGAYARPSDVETEIAKTIATDPSTWPLTTLKSETLVYLARRFQSRNDHGLIGKLIECLGKRVAQIARDFSSGLAKSVAEEFAIEIAEEVNLLIFAQTASRQSEFLECAFRTAVQRRSINKRAKLRDRLNHEKCESLLPAIESDGEEIGIVASHEDREPGPAERAMKSDMIRRGLEAVSNPLHREAIILHYLKGWPIKEEDETVPTLSTHFGKTDRQIRIWLAKARSEMRAALGDAI